MLKWLTAGESHGEALVGILDGLPAGIEITTEQVAQYLATRRHGYGRGARQKFEQDQVSILGGVRHGVTTGAPIALLIKNSEWPKWEVVMSPDPVRPEALLVDAGKGDKREIARNKALTRPRPGHADLAGMLAYDQDDARNVLERASARETATRVGLGAFAQEFLRQAAGIELVGQVRQIGTVGLAPGAPAPRLKDREVLAKSPVRCQDEKIAQLMMEQIDQAHKNADTIGGVVEVAAYGVPIGLGTHTQSDRRLDARLAARLMSIQSVKAVQIGDGFSQAAKFGSQAHDQIEPIAPPAEQAAEAAAQSEEQNPGETDLFGFRHPAPKGASSWWGRSSNQAGGIEGGMSNGQPLRASVALKPISTVPQALQTLDLKTGQPAQAIHQRSDACAVVPAVVIVQAEMALVLADALLDHLGGYSVAQVKDNLAAYQQRVEGRLK